MKKLLKIKKTGSTGWQFPVEAVGSSGPKWLNLPAVLCGELDRIEHRFTAEPFRSADPVRKTLRVHVNDFNMFGFKINYNSTPNYSTLNPNLVKIA